MEHVIFCSYQDNCLRVRRDYAVVEVAGWRAGSLVGWLAGWLAGWLGAGWCPGENLLRPLRVFFLARALALSGAWAFLFLWPSGQSLGPWPALHGFLAPWLHSSLFFQDGLQMAFEG